MMKFRIELVVLLAWISVYIFILFNDSVRARFTDFVFLHKNSAFLIFCFTQLLCATFIIPCSLLTVMASMIWGFGYGLLYSILATFLSAIWTYCLGKFLLKRYTSLHLVKTGFFPNVVVALNKSPTLGTFLAFCNPILPGSSLGYLFSSVRVNFKSYAIGAFFGIVPLQTLFAFFGNVSLNYQHLL